MHPRVQALLLMLPSCWCNCWCCTALTSQDLPDLVEFCFLQRTMRESPPCIGRSMLLPRCCLPPGAG
jgi:hypothetical protein